MNAPIVRLFALVIVLFAVLVAFTSRWTVFEAAALRDNPANRRPLLEEQRIDRGELRSTDGRGLARSVRLGEERFGRRYPIGELFAHAVGYAYTNLGRAGLEKSRNDALTGRRTELISVIDSLLGPDNVGDDVRTTLHARGQRVAAEAMQGRTGAVVALDVDSGGVLVMLSNPSYDPNGLDAGGRFARLRSDDVNSPLLNRATQGLYAPGSTFKVLTAAAALDSGRYEPGSVVDGSNGKVISGVPLNNFGGQDFGAIDLTTALTKSVNTVWAEVGVELGRDTMGQYMERFGFYAEPDLDYPPEQIAVSGERRSGRLLSPASRFIDVGRMAIGQDKLAVTPLQMAIVAQTVANGGVRLEPHLTERISDPDGRTIDELEPERAGRVISEAAARALTAMMRNVVREGTGTAAALEGVTVAGKTGTAEIDVARDINQPWFIGFTDEVAVAVTLERVQGGQGGTVAAPVAKRVLQALGE
jgi:peptidoglycan glycosyltransferase